jgi:hypothetical protein
MSHLTEKNIAYLSIKTLESIKTQLQILTVTATITGTFHIVFSLITAQ